MGGQDLSFSQHLQHDPASGLRANRAQLAVRVEGGRMHGVRQFARPHRLVRQSVPQRHSAVVGAGEELMMRGVHREAPQLVLVAFHDRRKVQAERALREEEAKGIFRKVVTLRLLSSKHFSTR